MNVPAFFTMIGIWNESIDTAHQCGFTTTASTSNQHYLSLLERKVDILDCGLFAPLVAEAKVFHGDGRFIVHAWK